ncbi:MAG: cytochrome c [Thermoanaerobaculales bacterium]|nr:cytochrome c [Thermoanaerobaculales bacterium]
MKKRIVVLTTLGFLAVIVACNQQTTPEMSATTTAAKTPPPAYAPAPMNVATPAPDGSQQIAEGAKLVGKGLKKEAQQAMAAGGAALERAGEQLQESAAAAVPQSTEPATQPAPEPPARGDVANGAVVFKAKCTSCHGADAGGDTAMGKKNNIPDLRSPVVQDLTDAELATVIANGKPNGPSASAHKSKAPSGDQMKDLIAYLRSIRM